jgi:3-hydroxybutyryl-CoA dehydrogenase
VFENFANKSEIFKKADAIFSASTVFASNTSGLSITGLASAVSRGRDFIGLHFFNPVPIMTLLEIVKGENTSKKALASAKWLATKLGKEAIVVNDSPGFATSRLGICLAYEAIRMLESGVASAEDIDKAMVLGYGHPIGPLKLTDLVGLDVRLAIGQHLFKTLAQRHFEPPALLIRFVEEGLLGQKSGRGFYSW